MARSIRPTVWIEPPLDKPAPNGRRVRREVDGVRLPDIAVGHSKLHAKEVAAREESRLWEQRLNISLPSTVTIAQWRDEYLQVCLEQNPKSYANFDERAVKSLADFVGPSAQLRVLDAAVDLQGAQDRIRLWKAHLEAAGGRRRGKAIQLGPTTVRMRMAHASAGLSWARKRGWLKVNPFEAVELPKAKKYTRVLTAAEFQLIYEQILPPAQWDWFTALKWTGLRKEELVGLSKEQVIPPPAAVLRDEPGTLWRLVFLGEQTKNGKPKAVEVHPEAQAALARAMARSSSAQVFEGLTDDKVEHWFGRIAERLGRVTPHTLKHTFCTRYMEATGDLDSLALLTGNSRRSLEVHYIHLSRPRSLGVLKMNLGYAPRVLPRTATEAPRNAAEKNAKSASPAAEK